MKRHFFIILFLFAYVVVVTAQSARQQAYWQEDFSSGEYLEVKCIYSAFFNPVSFNFNQLQPLITSMSHNLWYPILDNIHLGKSQNKNIITITVTTHTPDYNTTIINNNTQRLIIFNREIKMISPNSYLNVKPCFYRKLLNDKISIYQFNNPTNNPKHYA